MTRVMEIDDLGKISYVGDPRISPDGSRVAYVVTQADIAGRKYRSTIWIAATDGSSERRFTSGSHKDSAPRWSPNGRELAFLSDRSGTTQLYAMPADGGEPRQLSDLKNGVADPVWSPDGSKLAITSKIGPEGMVLLADQTDEDRKREAEKSDVKVIRSLKYKFDGEGFLGDLYRHIFVVSADDGTTTQLTDGDWDDAGPAWSPDGKTVAFVSNRTDNREFNRFSDIWLASTDNGEPRLITHSDGQYATPVFSPDGTRIAFTGAPISEEFGPNTITNLWVQSLDDGDARAVSAALDREIGGTSISDAHYVAPAQLPVWASDGASILATFGDHGSTALGRFSLDGQCERIIDGPRELLNFSASNDGALAVIISDSAHPFEVFASAPDGSGLRQISHANAEFLAEVAISDPESFVTTTSDGTELDTWLLKPPGFDPTTRYPLILQIHGGPHGMYGHTFYHEFQVLAAQGYLVLYCNPRGSTGSGQQFVNAAAGDWGGVDYRDLMEVVDQACERPYVDTNRLGVTGGSYGGYMTNWMITQTDRFKAAVTMRSTCNRHNLTGTSDMVWSYASWEFGGTSYDRTEFYLERSPLTYIKNVQTPVLIMHSENDYRCPIEQGEQLFVALKLHSKETEFVRFPNESHGLSRSGRPDHRVERLERMVEWFARHL
ncbi:MAG TPA: S9 family peptidase [Nitrolancea sp.]